MLVVNYIANALDDRKHCAALFVDLSKAFDTVDHAILLSKLSSIGVGTDACRWFYDYLKDRTQAVMVDGVKSDSLQLLKGVPQGSIIGPLLFSLYINNVGDDVRYCKFHLYADDTVMYSIAPTADQALMQLESDFRILQGSLLQLKLVLNAKKTNVMFFSRSKLSVRNTFVITSLDGTQIKQVSAYKYLGVWLDDRLSFKKHVTELGKKLKFKIGFLYRNRACLSFVNRKQIVQATFMSVLDYGDIIYMHASANTLKPLDAIYHCALRFITGDSYKTHHCILYQHVGWASLSVR
uniref:Reverse transcriptase domain-containing protein n=1 Tax=Salmo trutta TaxID=8032 RepID=A0A673ZIM1_SALTR